MKLLEQEPTAAPAAPDAPAPPEAGAPARACERCGAPMEAEQDWCLSCGAAAPGRLGERPGWRAAMTVLALTLVLVAGSVAAAYAALTSDATQEAAAPPPPAADAVAQAPPATPPSSAIPPAPKVKLPKIPSASATTTGGAVTPAPPPPPAPARPQSTSSSSSSTSSSSTGSSSSKAGSGSTGASTPTPKPRHPATTTKQPAPKPLSLPASAGALYDPGAQAVAPTDPSKALDGDPATGFAVGALTPSWRLGYVIDVQKLRGLREIDITTSTPGFTVQVFATDEATPPPDITDTRWARIHLTRDIGTPDGSTKIKLGTGKVSKYRTVLLWITKGPSKGDRIRLDEISVLV